MVYENTPRLETSRLILRQFTIEDLEALFEILSDREVNTYLPWFALQNLEEAEVFLKEQFLAYYDKASSYRYALCLKEDNKAVGYVCLADKKSCDFGYGLKKELWHKGIVFEAAQAILDRIKGAGYAYITATHDIHNLRSGAVMKKLGMVYKYSYVEQVQPKDVSVTFRMYQINFDGNTHNTYMEYWDKSENHFIEKGI